MESNISEILKSAIELDEKLIENYLREQLGKSKDSSQIFFGKLVSKIYVINQEELSVISWLLCEDLGGWFKEMGLINRALETEGRELGIGQRKFINYHETLLKKFKIVSNIVNQLFEQSNSSQRITPNSDSYQPKQEAKKVNNFNSLPIDKVINHFNPLIKKEIKGERWMSNEDFEIFIRRSFGMEKLPKPKIKVGQGTKYALVKLFYQFYEKCLTENISENNKKAPFITLLKEAFDTDSFDDIRSDNFKKRNSKYEWV
jgi:hypothetical protein